MGNAGPIIGKATWRRRPLLVRALATTSGVVVLLALAWASTPTIVDDGSYPSRLSCSAAVLGASANPFDSGGKADEVCEAAQWERVRPVVLGAIGVVTLAGVGSGLVLLRQRRPGRTPVPT